jgi:hypothetical protein
LGSLDRECPFVAAAPKMVLPRYFYCCYENDKENFEMSPGPECDT